MKTIKTLVEAHKEWGKMPIGTLLRVRDNDAKRLVDGSKAQYVPKSEWKKLRDQEKQQETNKEANNA